MTCKFWNGLITEGKTCTFAEYFSLMFAEHKPANLTWAQVFSSLPTLFLVLGLVCLIKISNRRMREIISEDNDKVRFQFLTFSRTPLMLRQRVDMKE